VTPARSPGFALFALLLAFALGAGHALAPGHGKALVGAWLLGSQGRPRDALALGAAITVTHTASVFAVGALALVIEQHVGSDKVLRALELMSGAMVVGVALSQLPGRVRALRAPLRDPAGEPVMSPISLRPRDIVAMGVSGGMVPCPGALVVLLAAVSMRRVGFGLALLVAFSLGLAAVLSGVGLLFVLARRWFHRLPGDGRGLRLLAVLSSCAVLALGVSLVAKAVLP
jgi:nickel/cobalt exporter